MFSKMNIFQCQPKSQKFPVLSNFVPQDQDNEMNSDGNTNMCQAMNSPSGDKIDP